ncbi:MAG: hypothetical protein E7468_01370 [Ruminococcaceae bacterium]|nr:hypothetical protein [Oscillospiraceae bacterium]
MINLNPTVWQDKAIEKTTAERKEVKGQRESIMADHVLDMIHEFCIQSEDFAQAVAEGGTFAACMTTVAKGVGNSISDIDAYKKAVQFYFPGAEIQVQMQIITEKKQENTKPIMLSLEDLLGD